jgi:hypothetical protein
MEKFRCSGTTLINQSAIMKKLREDLTLGMPATIQCRIIILPLFYPKTKFKICRMVNLPAVFWV